MPVISAKCPMNKSARLELSSLTKLELDKPDPYSNDRIPVIFDHLGVYGQCQYSIILTILSSLMELAPQML